VPAFTPLESAVMEALAWDLRDVAPDLAGQFEESLPGQRRNTGLGSFTEMIVGHSRPAAAERATGAFGTVHAMVGDLPDPVAFKVRLREGRLLALEGDAYGQDTRGIDFAAAPFDQVFTVDDQGRSIAFDPRAIMKPSPLLELQTPEDAFAPAIVSPPPLVNIGALQGVQEPASRPDDLMTALFGARSPADAPASVARKTPLSRQDRILLIGVWAVLAMIGLFASLLFRFPLVLALLLPLWLGRLAGAPAVLSALRRALTRLRLIQDSPSR